MDAWVRNPLHGSQTFAKSDMKFVLCRTYKTPSYLVQKLFSTFQGLHSLKAEIVYSDNSQPKLVAASATLQSEDFSSLAIKVGECCSLQ